VDFGPRIFFGAVSPVISWAFSTPRPFGTSPRRELARAVHFLSFVATHREALRGRETSPHNLEGGGQ